MERATFFDRLRQSRLLSEADLEQAASRFGDDKATQEIADALIEDGVLTPFQARQVCTGDTQPLMLGQYRILDEVGRGGMGHVYKALHTIMGRVVAIKVISPDLVCNPVAVEWFRREVRASTQLVHPNIVMAFDANEAEGLHFLVMEFVDGVTLDALVKQHGPLPIDHACALMRQAALGLQYAHEKGMVHRDIKPGNLLIPRRDSEQAADVLVKILDFGLARLHSASKSDTISLRAETGLLGTPDYISPEQSRDIHAADIRSDLYSLGCTFYYALTGQVPFPGETAMEKLIKHMMEDPARLEEVRPEVPPAVADIVRCLMAKDPAQRYQTPAELVRDLDAGPEAKPKVVPATRTHGRPLWISPPTHVPAEDGAGVEPPSSTKMLDKIEMFPLEREIDPSGPCVLEPLWKHAPGEERQVHTHDTLSLSHPEGTEATKAAATALEKERGTGYSIDSDSTMEEVPAAPPASPTSDPALDPRRINLALRRRWRRWTALIETIVEGRGPSRVDSGAYRSAHAALLQVCRLAVESAATPQRRDFCQRLVSIVQPWMNLQTFAHTEAQMLDALLDRCKEVELELNDGKHRWTPRQLIGMALLLLSPIGLALWYWNSGRLWLPALVRSFRGGSVTPSLRSAWGYVAEHPSILMGVIFPVVIVISVFMLSRTPRT